MLPFVCVLCVFFRLQDEHARRAATKLESGRYSGAISSADLFGEGEAGRGAGAGGARRGRGGSDDVGEFISSIGTQVSSDFKKLGSSMVQGAKKFTSLWK